MCNHEIPVTLVDGTAGVAVFEKANCPVCLRVALNDKKLERRLQAAIAVHRTLRSALPRHSASDLRAPLKAELDVLWAVIDEVE